jgi:hypothetical protein
MNPNHFIISEINFSHSRNNFTGVYAVISLDYPYLQAMGKTLDAEDE